MKMLSPPIPHLSVHCTLFYFTFLGGDRIIVRRRSLRGHSECAVGISQNSGHIQQAQWGLPKIQPHSGKKGSKGERKFFTHPPTALIEEFMGTEENPGGHFQLTTELRMDR